jgi:hypothetical protein
MFALLAFRFVALFVTFVALGFLALAGVAVIYASLIAGLLFGLVFGLFQALFRNARNPVE